MSEKSMLEKVTGSLPASAGASALAVVGATFTPWAAFAPFLLQTLASRKQSERVEQMFAGLTAEVERLRIEVRDISDDQYKLAGECVVSAFSTVEVAKLEYIRIGVMNALTEPSISRGTADALGRLVRDISTAEAAFLVENFRFTGVTIDAEHSSQDGRLFVKPNTQEEILVGGLIRLGVLYARFTNWDSMMYEWSPLTAKFIALITQHDRPQKEA